jgi:nucleotide-binding universal stress UspA family protein
VHAYPEDDHNPDATRKAVQQFVDKAASETGETPAEITVDVVTGDAAEELINASRDADMVVVGSRGGGGFAQLLMGSVSSKVTHHAACPVVVVRATRQAP